MMYLMVFAAALHVAAVWLAAARRGLAARRGQTTSPASAPAQFPFVSIVVPAWRERGTIERCIESLRQVDYPCWEAVVVAGGPDGTYEAALDACRDIETIRVVEQQPLGKNAALNEGVRAARGEVIVLLDADSQVSPGWLRALVAPLNGTVQAAMGNPVALRQTPVSAAEQMERIAAWSIRNHIELQGSGSIALRRSLLDELGGFPEDVAAGVDWDLNARLAARGVERAFSPSADVYTERPATLGEYWHNEVRWRRAHLASLFRLRSYFLGALESAAASLYLYALAWFAAALTAGTAVVVLSGRAGLRGTAGIVWATFAGWVTLRRVALAVEVAAFTGEAGWLRRSWVPPVLLWATFAASCVASLTPQRTTRHFKGPRSAQPRRLEVDHVQG